MGVTVIDAGVLIGFLDSHDVNHLSARRALVGAVDSDVRVALPASEHAEVLEGPGRRGGVDAYLVDQVIESMPIEVVPLDAAIEQRASELCAGHDGLGMPAALAVATTEAIGAEALITTRKDWPSPSDLTTTVEIHVV